MTVLLHDLISKSAERFAAQTAVAENRSSVNYEGLADKVRRAAAGFMGLGVRKGDRIAVYLPKTLNNVVAMFGATLAGGIMVPVNPVLKAGQVAHILKDSGSTILVTSETRLQALMPRLAGCPALQSIIVTDGHGATTSAPGDVRILSWQELVDSSDGLFPKLTETDIAAILYTSGSTGKPKGVVLNHRNIVVGAESVSEYLQNSSNDVILAMLPLSFDAGFSQLTTAFKTGATVALLDFLLPNDVIKACERHKVNCLTGVPPLWMQLVDKKWPEPVRQNIRYFANTGGKMPRETLQQLRDLFPVAKPYMMYGLTESFRSTYLDPAEVDRKPDSIGKAIPNAEVLVVNDTGEICRDNEPGELVHLGPLVAQGYWNDPDRTKTRYRPAPGQLGELPLKSLGVWSGDMVRRDEEGFLYFVSRRDDMIKTSGYRVSPTEIEELAFESGLVAEAAALGVPHKALGQAILLVAKPTQSGDQDTATLLSKYKEELPAFMLPMAIVWCDKLPRNSNGKIDRPGLLQQYADYFSASEAT